MVTSGSVMSMMGRCWQLESVNNVAALSLFMDPNNYNLDFSQADEVIPGIETVHRMCLDKCQA